jgi:plastocyanin
MFQPSPLHVAVGTTVTWTNQDQIDHRVTSGTPKHPTDGFDGALPKQRATFETTFSKPGTYPYFCRIHNVMRGVIVVTA